MSHSVLGAQFTTREGVREHLRLAQVAQQERAESYSHGHHSEEQSFYGHSDRPQSSEAESRLTLAQADAAHAANRRYENEQAESYSPMSDEEWRSIMQDIHGNG